MAITPTEISEIYEIDQLKIAYGETFEIIPRLDKLILIAAIARKLALNTTMSEALEAVASGTWNDPDVLNDFETTLDRLDWTVLLQLLEAMVAQLQGAVDGESESFSYYYRQHCTNLLKDGAKPKDARLAAEGLSYMQVYEGTDPNIYQREAISICEQQMRRVRRGR